MSEPNISQSSPDLMTVLFNPKGRIRRSTFWLYGIGIGLVFGILIAVASIVFDRDSLDGVILLLVLPLAYMSIVLRIKRWHDRDKSGWWILIALIPLIGALWSLVENGFLDGTQGPNRYGPSPKGL